jgi:hypothetical protein
MSYLYVMQNDRLPGLVQIGMTDDDLEVRARELNNVTGVLGRFAVARQWQVKDAAIYERRISAVLGCYHVSGEHFRLPVEGAIGRITVLLYSWGIVNEEGLTRDEAITFVPGRSARVVGAPFADCRLPSMHRIDIVNA